MILIGDKKLCNAVRENCDFICDNKIGICKAGKIIVEKPQIKFPKRSSVCENPNCFSATKPTFHHFYPKQYRKARIETRKFELIPIEKINTGIMLCENCHRAVHRLKTNEQLFIQKITDKKQILKLLHSNQR